MDQSKIWKCLERISLSANRVTAEAMEMAVDALVDKFEDEWIAGFCARRRIPAPDRLPRTVPAMVVCFADGHKFLYTTGGAPRERVRRAASGI